MGESSINIRSMPEALKIKIKYDGSDVDDGAMPIGDVLSALQGFSNGYGKIASTFDRDRQHQLRVSAVETGSFELVVVAWVVATQGTEIIHTVQTIAESSRWIVGKITGLIAAKKHIKGQPYNFHVDGNNNTVIVINAEGSELALPPEVFELLESKLIDGDLHKIAAPLKPHQIDSATIKADEGGDLIEESITSEERAFFSAPEVVTTTKETEITGRLVSLNKENNRGSFRLGNGKNIRYRYAGNSPHQFHVDFSYQGTVRVRCIASLDENLEPTHLDILGVEHLQGRLPLESN